MKAHLTKQEEKVLAHIDNNPNIGERNILEDLDLQSNEVHSAICNLEKRSFITGKTSTGGWLFLRTTGQGQDIQRDVAQPWLKKVDWKYLVTNLISVGALIVSIIALNK